MEYRCISADCHIDLCWLPHDLFVANAWHARKDRMPPVVNGPDGPARVAKSGENLGLANDKGSFGDVGVGLSASGLRLSGFPGIHQKQFGDWPLATQRKITCDNAGKFYGLIPA